MAEYTRQDFEQGLPALGELLQLAGKEITVEHVEDDQVVIKGLLGRKAVALFGQFPHFGPTPEEDVVLEANRTLLSVGSDREKITLRTPDASPFFDNPYDLVGYFPDGNNGQGEAALYQLPRIEVKIPAGQTDINVPEAIKLIYGNRIPSKIPEAFYSGGDIEKCQLQSFRRIHDSGQQRRLRHELQASLSRSSLIETADHFGPQAYFAASLDTNDGEFTLIQPKLTYVNFLEPKGPFYNDVTYYGAAELIFQRGFADVLRLLGDVDMAHQQLQKLTGFNKTVVQIPEDEPLILRVGPTKYRAYNLQELRRMLQEQDPEKIPSNVGLINPSAPVIRSFSQYITKLIQNGTITVEDLKFEDTSPLEVLYRTLAQDGALPHSRELLSQLRPKPDVDVLVAELRDRAMDAWKRVFAGEESVRPAITGLGRVANQLNFRNV